MYIFVLQKSIGAEYYLIANIQAKVLYDVAVMGGY